MQLTEMKCPRCGAVLEIDPEEEQVTCEFCGARFFFDNGIQSVKVDNAEEAGYQFERGRQRAREERERERERQRILAQRAQERKNVPKVDRPSWEAQGQNNAGFRWQGEEPKPTPSPQASSGETWREMSGGRKFFWVMVVIIVVCILFGARSCQLDVGAKECSIVIPDKSLLAVDVVNAADVG